MRFPLASRPTLSYKTGGRRYGAPRDGGARLHAACDLIVPEGTEILAVAAGIVTKGPYHYFRGTYAVEVRHSTFLARYCEIGRAAREIRTGTIVWEGQIIAYVGRMYVESMLHFEMYSGTAPGALTQKGKGCSAYQRRSDLLDPTSYLDRWPVKGPDSFQL